MGAAWRHRRTGSGLNAHDGVHTITPEELELELAELGLSGRRFNPPDYAAALERRLGTKILFRFVDPLDDPATLRRVAVDGGLADARYLEHRNVVLISLPSSLPPFLLVLTAFHELAHIAAGDVIEGKRLTQGGTLREESAREDEADMRARHLYMAGSLGAENPYALN